MIRLMIHCQESNDYSLPNEHSRKSVSSLWITTIKRFQSTTSTHSRKSQTHISISISGTKQQNDISSLLGSNQVTAKFRPCSSTNGVKESIILPMFGKPRRENVPS